MMSGIKRKKISPISAIAFMNILLALAAVIRDISLAGVLGTSPQSDAFLLAFSIPDLAGNNLIAVAAGAAAIPVLTEILMEKGDEAFASSSVRLTVFVLSVSALLLLPAFFFRETLISFLGRGMDEATAALCVRLLTVMLPALLFYPLYTMGASVLHIRSSFLLPASAPVVFNMVYLAGIFAGPAMGYEISETTVTISYAVLAGTAGMAVMVWGRILKREKVSACLSVRDVPGKDGYRKYLGILLPYLGILGAYMTVFFAERYMASILGEGTISGLNYAYRIAQMPSWIFVAAIGTFSLPALSRLNSASEGKRFSETAFDHLLSTFIVALPFTVFIYIMRVPIVETLLERGEFGKNSVEITAGILQGYSLAVLGLGVFAISIRFFISMRYMLVPTLIIIFSSAVNITADFILTKRIGSEGLGVGAALGAAVNVILLLLVLDIKLGGIIRKRICSLLKTAGACALLIPYFILSEKVWTMKSVQMNGIARIVFLGLIFILAASIYLIILRIIKIRMPCGKRGAG